MSRKCIVDIKPPDELTVSFRPDFEFQYISVDPSKPDCIRKSKIVDEYELDFLLYQRNRAFRLLQRLYEQYYNNYPMATSCGDLDMYEVMIDDLTYNKKIKKSLSFFVLYNKLKNKLTDLIICFRIKCYTIKNKITVKL